MQKKFEASRLVCLQELHQGNSISGTAIEGIGSLYRKDFFNEDGSRKTHIRGIIPCRASVQRSAEAICFTMERTLAFDNMAASVLSDDGQCIILNLKGMMSSVISDCNYVSEGYGYSFELRLNDGIGEPKKSIQWAFSVDGGR